MTLSGRLLLAALFVASRPAWALQSQSVMIFTAAGNGSTTSSGDGGTAVAAGLAQPVDVASDGNGNWYILDASSRTVRRVAPDNTIATVASLPSVPNHLAVARDGTLFVSMSAELRKIATNGTIVSYAQTATGLAVDGEGNVFMADPSHHVVRRLSTTGQVTIVAGNTQSPGKCMDGLPATGACLTSPSDAAVGPDGTVYIGDPGNHGIWRLSGGAIYSMPSQMQVDPLQIAVSKDGSIVYFTQDYGGGPVGVISLKETHAGYIAGGTRGFCGDGYLAASACLDNVGGLFADDAGNLVIADTNNHRVRRLRLETTPGSSYDFINDRVPDLVWRNRTGLNVAWNNADASLPLRMAAVSDADWEIVGGGDFDGAGGLDLLWRNRRTGGNAIWRSGDATFQLPIPAVTNVDWKIVGIGEFDRAPKRDILWRNVQTGANTIWLGGSASTPRVLTSAGVQWQVAGLGDFNGDGVSDILWRNTTTGANAIWRSGNAATSQTVATANTAWMVAAVGDFDGDGRSDIFWRNPTTGANVIWRSGDARMVLALDAMPAAWSVVHCDDQDSDAAEEVLWRNASTGANLMWHHRVTGWEVWSVASAAPGWTPAR